LYVGITSFLKLIKDWMSLQDINLKLGKNRTTKTGSRIKNVKGAIESSFSF
jgi:two-component system, LytTR family, sensor kinase